jgi:hypothetical protein
MKKLIALMFAMLFLGAGIAGASDLSMTGSYFVRGQYYDNVEYNAAFPNNDRSYGYYDHELSVDTRWKMDDTTFVTARFEMRDATWGKNPVFEESATVAQLDDNIIVEHVWGQTTFANGIVLRVGLMPAGAWGTDFANTMGEAYRIFATVPTQIGAVIAILERGAGNVNEFGSPAVGEDEDDDIYHLAMVTKIGDINVKPIVSYIDAASETAAEWSAIVAQLSLDGKLGALGFEADFVYRDYDRSGALVDFDVWGAYGNVWYQMQALKVGGFLSYGSWDEDAQASFDTGDDYYPGNLLIIGDDFLGDGVPGSLGADGVGQTGDWGMGAGTLFGIYGSYAVTDKLSLSAVAAYAWIDRDNPTPGSTWEKWDDAEIFEISAGFVYKITPSLTYDGGVGMAEVDFGNGTPDPDTIFEAFHRLSFAF